MSEDRPISLKDFGALFKEFLEQVVTQSLAEEPVFVGYLRTHFNKGPMKLPILAEAFEISEHPNLHLAIEAYLAGKGRSAELLGVTGVDIAYRVPSLSELLTSARSGLTQGPVQYINITLDNDQVLACVQWGLYLIHDGDQRLAVLVRGPREMGFPRKLHVEVMAVERTQAERFLVELRNLMWQRNVYRGRVVSLTGDRYDGANVRFHQLPKIERDQIVLSEGLLARIERQTMGFAQHKEKLLAAGRHLKRGILLHGAPGAGKTLTAMYLASQMRDRTVLLLTGRGLGLIEQSCAMARALQPSMVILEDVDLVAEERTRPTASCTALLFELLNQMDGLANDADVMFLLTTNRPDILEPALAARPGRIDQAIELPLPDVSCRRRLLELYARDLTIQLTEFDRFVERTEGASPAFIRELIRKAALFAADEPDEIVVRDRHMDEALHELIIEGGELTKTLLGMQQKAM